MSRSLPSSSAVLAFAFLLPLACSSGGDKLVGASATRAPLENLTEDTKDRVIVAEVNGVPVFADCVERQANTKGLSKEAALDECVSFELLAQAANQPDYLHAPEVQELATQELVRSFVKSEYGMQDPEDVPDQLVAELWHQVGTHRYNRPEIRDIVFCRIELPDGAGPKNEDLQKAKRYLTGVYNKLKSRKSLTQDELFEACYGALDIGDENLRPYKLAGINELLLQTATPMPRSRLLPEFRARVFDGPEEEGMVVPPLYTQYGYDLILLKRIAPELKTDFATVEPELRKALLEEPVYEAQREALFYEWYEPLEQRHQVTRNPELIHRTQQAITMEAVPAEGHPPAPAGVTP